MKKYSQLQESFITKYLFWNRIQEIPKVFLPQKFGAIQYIIMLYHINYCTVNKVTQDSILYVQSEAQ